jgi:hypothetical protein
MSCFAHGSKRPRKDALASYLPPGHGHRPKFLAALKRLSEAEPGGTPLSNEDRLFSLYKYHQPAFHNIVRDIYENEKCGRVMVPSKIAASAIRIANALAHQRRDARPGRNARPDEGNGIPDVNQFASAIGQDAEDKNGVNLRGGLDELFGIVNWVPAGEGRFSKAFIRLFEALRYDKKLNPLGLPKVLLCRLPPNLIHVLLFWLLQERRDAQFCNNDLIRFVMFWLLCSRNDDKISALCFTRVRESGEHEISLRALFSAIREDSSLSRELVKPDEMARILVGEKREWRSLIHRIEKLEPPVEPPAAEMVERWWRDQNNFLPWMQRAYLDAAFPEYDPTADREDDTPHDVDHMVPYSDWGFDWRWRDQRLPDESEDSRKSLRWVRVEIGNGIGNKWLVDGSINRSWGDISFTEKLECIKEYIKKAADPSEALLDVFEEGSVELWQMASPQGTQTKVPPHKHVHT